MLITVGSQILVAVSSIIAAYYAVLNFELSETGLSYSVAAL